MLFNTWAFALFLPCVLAAYYMLQRRGQNLLLLLASYFFYACWDWRFCGLLLLSTIVDFLVGRALSAGVSARRRGLLLLSICTNLGILGFFKYCNFFLGSAASLLESLGLAAHLPVLSIVLPVGISFYTFQTLAYTIDVYRGSIPAETSIIEFGLYVAYFPQLVAGPIERAGRLLPQFRTPRRVTQEHLASGAILILIGLLRKVVIADNAAAYVDQAFSNPSGVAGLDLTKAVLYFSLQIYGDFAGYSDMARGISRLLGIELMENFSHPYFARSISGFWRKWHISLSTWLRDYLYIPLGGNRGSRVFAYRNLMLTMLLGGLWHGAAWTFIVWGGIHGVALALHKMWMGGRRATTPRDPARRGPRRTLRSSAYALGGWAITMACVGLAWVFFRAPDFSDAFGIIRRIVTFASGSVWIPGGPALAMVLLILAIDLPQALTRDHLVWLRWPWFVRGFVYAAAVLLILLCGSTENVPFIYFQF